MAVSKRTRFEVLRRDNHTCRYCGGRTPDVVLTVDHVVPTALGGSDDPSNLVAACKDCNAGKSASSPDAPLVAQVADDAIRWAAAMRVAVDDWLAVRESAQDYAGDFVEQWDDENQEHRYGKAPIPVDWRDSLERWRKLGVPVEMVTDAVSSAMRRRTVAVGEVWRYVCGIVWSKLSELQEAAGTALSTGGEPGSADPLGDAYYEGQLHALMGAERRFSAYQHRKLCAVTDAEGMAWAANR